MTTKSSLGQRGKKAEKAVEAVLKQFNGRADFAYHRMADSRSARNFLAANPADFIFACGQYMGFIEVKETEHSYRIAKDKISQLPTLHKFSMAGATSLILIHHSKDGVWRVIRVEDLCTGVPSWDLSDYPTFDTPEAALLSTGFF